MENPVRKAIENFHGKYGVKPEVETIRDGVEAEKVMIANLPGKKRKAFIQFHGVTGEILGWGWIIPSGHAALEPDI